MNFASVETIYPEGYAYLRRKRMKEWLGSSKMNILSLFDQLTNWWDGITTNVTQNVSTEQQEAVISMSGRLFGQCQ